MSADSYPIKNTDAYMELFTELLIEWGYWGLFLAAMVAGSILPFSSETVMVGLIYLGLDPVLCLVAATAGNTLGGMSCYGIGRLGRGEWIMRLGVSERRMAQARMFLAGRGALMAFFCFLPLLGEAIAIVLGLLRSNVAITFGAMTVGKGVRYAAILLLYQGAVSFL